MDFAGQQSNKGRLIREDKEGNLYSEVSITFQLDNGKWINIASIDAEGKPTEQADLEDFVRKNGPKDPVTGEKLPVYDSVEEAVSAAEERSNNLLPEMEQGGLMDKEEYRKTQEYADKFHEKLFEKHDKKINQLIDDGVIDPKTMKVIPYRDRITFKEKIPFTDDLRELDLKVSGAVYDGVNSLIDAVKTLVSDEDIKKDTPSKKGMAHGGLMTGDMSNGCGCPSCMMKKIMGVDMGMMNTLNMSDMVGTDPVSGNEIPPGSNAENVRDDLPVMLSDGEYVMPADAVRYHGLKFLDSLRMEAKAGLMSMMDEGQIQTIEEEEEAQQYVEAEDDADDEEAQTYTTEEGNEVEEPEMEVTTKRMSMFMPYKPSQSVAFIK